MLSEGKAEIGKFKKTVEGGVADAKAIYKEVTGVWSWIKGLFGNPNSKVPSIKPPESAPATTAPVRSEKKTATPVREEELSYEEYQSRAVHDICEQLKVYFESIRLLKQHCRELEEASLTTEKVADSAIDRIELEWQMAQLSTQIREAMVYTPQELGLQDLYKRFLQMYDQILEEQEFARQVQLKKERDGKWRRDLLRNHRIDRAVVVFTVLMVALWMWGVILSLGWLVKTRAGFSSVLSF
jgi:hypothetical protein